MMDQLKPSGSPRQPILDSDLLKAFVTVAECGSFTRAARLLFRTPAAISQQIKKLEEMIGQTVFVREPRRVYLSPEGEVLLGYSRRILKLSEEALEQFRAPSISGKITFGTTDDIGTRRLPGILAQFARVFPKVEVDVVVIASREALRRVHANELDMALIVTGNDGQADDGEIVHTEPLVWVGREGGLAIDRSPIPLAVANHGCVWRRSALDALDGRGLNYRIAYTCEHCAAQEAAMLADLAISPFPKSLIRPPLKQIDRDDLPPLPEYRVALIGQPTSPEVRALYDTIRSAFGTR